MSSGTVIIHPDQSFDFNKIWSGGNDPTRKVEQPYTMTVRIYRRTPLYTINFSDGSQEYSGYAPYGTQERFPSFTDFDWLAVLGKMIEQVRGHSWNAAVSAAELPESVVATVNTARSFYKAYKEVGKGNYSDAYRTLARATAGTGVKRKRAPNDTKDVAEAWISLQWGWKPLLNDIFSAWDAYGRLQESPRVFKARARHKVSDDAFDISSSKKPPMLAKAYKGVEYRTVYSEISVLSSLGLLDPELVVWEKIPFSCVVDWFTPIGDWLEARAFFGRFNHTTNYSTKESVECFTTPQVCPGPSWMWDWSPHSAYCCPPGGPQNASLAHKGCTQRTTWVNMRRQVGVSFNVPSSPGLKQLEKALSVNHMATAAALWRSFK